MTFQDMIRQMQLKTGNADDTELFEMYLEDAEEAILNRMYPFGYEENTVVPPKYHRTMVELAVRQYERLGAEGETYHSENGVHRTYGGGLNDPDLLSRITPRGKVY